MNRLDLGVAPLVDTEGDLRTKWRNAGKERQLAAMVGLSTQGVHGITSFPSDTPPSFSPYGGFGGFSGSGLTTVNSRGFRGFRFGGRELAGIPSTCVTPPTSTTESKGPNFGEGRLIFGAVGPDGQPLPGNWTLIFEYQLEPLSKVGRTLPNSAPGSLTAQDWAQAWHWLGGLELKDPRYAESLVTLTKAFTHRGTNDKGEITEAAKPSFSQLRSSEAAFGPGREFRQFDLQNGAFVPALLPLTPAPAFMDDRQVNGRVLGNFLNEIEPLIRAGIHSIPKTVEFHRTTFALQGATALIPDGEKDFHWDPAPHIIRDARRLFSMNTCNGCHAGDTGCPDGLHVHPRAAGMEAKVSDFLRRDGQPDKFQDPGLKTSYVRLTEMEDRAAILAALLEPKEKKRVDQLEDLLRSRLRRSH